MTSEELASNILGSPFKTLERAGGEILRMTTKRLRNFLAVICVFVAGLGSSARGATVDAVLEGAKKEGALVFYGTLELSTSQKLAALFTQKYPFIKVNVIRLGSERLAERVVMEGQAKSAQADVIYESEMDFYGLLKKGLIDSYDSPQRAAFRPQYKDDKGFWTISAETLNVIAYNTHLVKGADVPKSFSDLLAPKWKGKILIDENESKWMAAAISVWGEEKTLDFLRKLAALDVKSIGGHSQMQTLLAAGDAAIVAVSLVNGVELLKKRGAPVDWVAVEPLISRQFALALLKGAPHPNAAKLYIDFMLAKETQQELASIGYNSGRTDFQSQILKQIPAKLKIVPVRPEMGERYNEYFKLYRDVMGLK
jgi:iron(III) transport system substrate-binding protein